MRSTVLTALAVVVLAACGDDGSSFIDAGRDSGGGIDAFEGPAGMLPASLDLGPADCGGSTQRTFAVTNSGTTDLTFSLELSDQAFAVTPTSGSIVPGSTTTFTLTATVPQAATAGGTLTATLTASSNLPGSPHTVPVRVTPAGAHVTITPPAVGFGQVEAGTTSAPSTALVANAGTAPAVVAIAAPGGEFSRLFGSGGTITLAGGQSAVASFTYAPTDLGADSDASAVTVTGVHCGTAPTSIALTGTGSTSGGVLVQGTPVDFGTVACGATADTASVTLMNTASVPAPFTAAFLSDADGDDARYDVSPASGTIAVGGSATLTITRLAVTLPFQPRVIDATLRISTTVPTATATDVTVQQTLSGPYLTAAQTSFDFGFAPVGTSRTTDVTISNTGDVMAALQVAASPPFSVDAAATVAAGTDASAGLTYAPSAGGTVTDTATLDATGACSAPVTLSFAAGEGPYPEFSVVGAVESCPLSGNPLSGRVNVTNSGNQALQVSCVDTGTNDFGLTFTPDPLSVGAGSNGQIDVTAAPPSPPRASIQSTSLLCTTNEPVGNTHDVTFGRQISGADLTLAAAAPLDFTCGVPARLEYTVGNLASANSFAFPSYTDDLGFPLFHDQPTGSIGPGESVTGAVELSSPQIQFHGGTDLCATPGNPGDVIFTGQVSVDLLGTSGICSLTPANLPVVLRAPSP